MRRAKQNARLCVETCIAERARTFERRNVHPTGCFGPFTPPGATTVRITCGKVCATPRRSAMHNATDVILRFTYRGESLRNGRVVRIQSDGR